MSRKRLIWACGVLAWVAMWWLVFGPLWLLGWGVLHASKHINRLASLWCRLLLSVYPAP